MDLGLAEETALITASSSGLGKASAAALAAEGANVVVCGRTPERLDAAREELADLEGSVLAVEADITDPDDVDALVEATVAEFGGVDHVVTSAGGPPSGSFLDTEEADWYDAYDLLVMSAVRVLKATHGHLVESDAGTWTAITSSTVKEAADNLVLSNAVRRGVIGLVKTVAVEWAPEVRANAVLPGGHETARMEELIRDDVERGAYESYEAGLADSADGVPMGRLGDPRELGDTVAFLASDRAGFVNGASLSIDGGATRS
jgi:NAD(P)-dependent dehydrogenase (short-subunit alcohol dehydrogenase family)